MKKLTILFTAIIIAMAMLVGQTKISVAASATIESTDPVHSLEITRSIKDVATPVTNTFTYTITPDDSNPEGGASNVPTSVTMEFNSVTPDSNNYATETATIDFSGATFTKIGDYKFLVEETGSTDTTTYPVSTDKYYIYVQVRNEVDENDIPTGNIVATLVSQANLTTDLDTKTDIVFPAESNFTNLTLSKTVTGNMANLDEYFKFKLEINGTSGDEYVILGQDDTVTYGDTQITTDSTYNVGEDNYVYLKNGQTITIGTTEGGLNQIKVGTTYKIIEQDATDYETYIDESDVNNKESAEKTASAAEEENATTYENHKEQESITGVFISIAPFVIAILIAVIGIMAIKKSSSKDEEV